MWVESWVGQGSTFHFSLPLSKASLRGSAGRIHSIEHISPFPSPVDRSFLMIDSDRAIGRVLERHIEDYQALEAHGEQEALRLVQEYRPRAIITGTDPQLHRDRWSALDNTFRELPLIVCPLLDKPWAPLALSAEDYLVKPITREKLFSALDRADAAAGCVLIIDDSRHMVRLLDRMLKSREQPYRIMKAYSGEQALALMAQKHPDVVLLDLMMPEIDGAEVLRRMREDPQLTDVPVIVITAREYLLEFLPTEDMLQVKRKGGFSTSELVKCLKAILDSLEPRPASLANAPEQLATSLR